MEALKYIFLIATLGFVFLFAKNVFTLLFAMDNYNIHKKRLKQLQFSNKNLKSDEDQTKDLINKITTPVIQLIFPKLKLKNLEELKKDLALTKWDKYFTPIQYRAMQITLTIAGIFFGILVYGVSKLAPFALVWFVILSFGMPFLFRNSVNEQKTKLMSEFPDFIRITQGYLIANVPFVTAIEQAISYVGSNWKPLLQNFVVTCEIKSVEDGLSELQEKVDIFEVRELLSLIRLNLDQGIDIKESFDRQAEKVREMQIELITKKIGKRQMMCIMLQGPLLLVLLGSFALPTFSSMGNFTSM